MWNKILDQHIRSKKWTNVYNIKEKKQEPKSETKEKNKNPTREKKKNTQNHHAKWIIIANAKS